MKALLIGGLLLASAVEAIACSPGTAEYRYDTLPSGSVRLLRMEPQSWGPNPGVRTDTLGEYAPLDLEAKVRASLLDSSLSFIARFDSLWRDTLTLPSPILMFDTTTRPSWDFAVFRLRIDTVLRGTFPHANPVWIRLRTGFGSCTVNPLQYMNRPFLNASGGFSTRADLKMNFSPFPDFYSPFPSAAWFSGRYILDPSFPVALRLDITRVLADYPATGIAPRRLPGRAPVMPSGKAYLPNGREAASDGRTGPVPVLR